MVKWTNKHFYGLWLALVLGTAMILVAMLLATDSGSASQVRTHEQAMTCLEQGRTWVGHELKVCL